MKCIREETLDVVDILFFQSDASTVPCKITSLCLVSANSKAGGVFSLPWKCILCLNGRVWCSSSGRLATQCFV